MSSLQNQFAHHAFGFWLFLLLAVILLAGWVVYSSIQERRARAHYDSLLRAVDSGNVPAMLGEYLATVRTVSRQTTEMEQRVNFLYEALPHLVRHVGLVRFSPFHDTGSDQSFSLALLDGRGDGVVISALHSRHEHKLYAKPVAGRVSTYQLTDEEQRAIAESIQVNGVEG